MPVDLFLNEWISFRQPGHYRVVADSTRLVTVAQPNTRLPIQSSVLEIEVTAMDAAWAEGQLKQAMTVLDIPDPPAPRIGQSGPSFSDMRATQRNTENAARTLRFLETPAAARALVRYYERGPRYAQPQLRAGLAGTPCRKEVIAALEEAVAAPDIAIYPGYYGMLEEFAELAKLGPIPALQGTEREEMRQWIETVNRPYHERAKPIDAQVTAKLEATLALKHGTALAISLSTLGTRIGQMPSEKFTKALLANFTALPENKQWLWLTQNWPRIASPEAGPLLTLLASGSSNLRDTALLRLSSLNPDAARPIAIERIRRADVARDEYHNDRALLLLPDKTLPELDDALTANFERGLYHADILLARYASSAVADRVRETVERWSLCSGPILAYLFRVDPSYATARLKGGDSARCSFAEISSIGDLLVSPPLENQLVRQLELKPDSSVVQLLHSGGKDARQPLIEALVRAPDPQATGGSPAAANEYNLADAILTSGGWVLTAEELDRVAAACKSEPCRQRVATVRKQLQQPVVISSMEGTMPDLVYASVGPFLLSTPQQVKDKIAQFPKGASFSIHVPYPESWYGQKRVTEFRRMLETAGMKVVPDQSQNPVPHKSPEYDRL